MKRILKWIGLFLACLVVIGFFFFLYFIPPFTLAPAAAFIQPEEKAGPDLERVAVGSDRFIARRGEYLVKAAGCSGCHVAAGPGGAPEFDRYLAGGARITVIDEGAAYAYNLTPDTTSGLGSLSRDQIVRILKTGQLPDGRVLNDHQMPWTIYSHLTEEDLYAIATYLSLLKPVSGRIPSIEPFAKVGMPGAVEAFSIRDRSQY